MKPRLYLAAPLFTPLEREFNLRVTEQLEKRFDVFLPQRDGFLIPGREMSGVEFKLASRDVFRSDLLAIERAHAIVAVLDGRAIDEGVAFEVGFAFAKGIRCFSLRTDSRQLLPHGNNPMITNAVLFESDDIESISDRISQVLRADSVNAA